MWCFQPPARGPHGIYFFVFLFQVVCCLTHRGRAKRTYSLFNRYGAADSEASPAKLQAHRGSPLKWDVQYGDWLVRVPSLEAGNAKPAYCHYCDQYYRDHPSELLANTSYLNQAGRLCLNPQTSGLKQHAASPRHLESKLWCERKSMPPPTISAAEKIDKAFHEIESMELKMLKQRLKTIFFLVSKVFYLLLLFLLPCLIYFFLLCLTHRTVPSRIFQRPRPTLRACPKMANSRQPLRSMRASTGLSTWSWPLTRLFPTSFEIWYAIDSSRLSLTKYYLVAITDSESVCVIFFWINDIVFRRQMFHQSAWLGCI